MQHLRSNSSYFKKDNRKVPLNTIILPPISSPLPESDSQVVLVNKSKSGNVNGELVAVTRSPQDVNTNKSQDTPRGPESSRVAQLEQNIRFLQEQHQLMLSGLHKEIESLRNRNREFQFQLVFAKGSIPSSPSSPEEESKHKIYASPKQPNITPLQVELLEKELGELKIQITEIESRNSYLSAIVEEQRKKLEHYEHEREKDLEKTAQPDPDVVRKLEDAEAIIRRLRRENSDLRHEGAAGSPHYQSRDGAVYHNRENGSYQSRNGQNSQKSNGRHRGGNNHYRGNWFPPLHSQSYWQGGRQNDRNSTPTENGTLPSLQQNGTSNGSQHYHGRRGTNNNHYHNGDGRKYRGSQNKSSKPS